LLRKKGGSLYYSSREKKKGVGRRPRLAGQKRGREKKLYFFPATMGRRERGRRVC